MIGARPWPERGTPMADEAPSDQDEPVLADVEAALARGLQLRRWWEQVEAADAYRDRFSLVRESNNPDRSFGFFDVAPIDGQTMPVMGEVEERLFDRPKSAPDEAYRPQLREFALKYLMRVSDFRRPAAFAAGRPQATRDLGLLDWCPRGVATQQGFGYSQWFYKRSGTGQIGRFPEDRRFEIVDVREIGPVYEWVVVRVKIFDFTVRLRPFGPALQFQIPLDESSYLVLSREFIVDDSAPPAKSGGRMTAGRYGFGYAFVKSRGGGPLAYGPGEFDAAFQHIQFEVDGDGESQVRLVFVANRPVQIAAVPILPVDWAVRLTNVATLGMWSSMLTPLAQGLSRLAPLGGTFDPISTLVDAANLVTGGQAARKSCVSREQLEKTFLVQHFMQHYDMISGALQTWRSVLDWTDERSLPDWIRTGISS